MATHDLWLKKLPSLKLSNANAVFAVFEDSEKFGELHLSKGNIEWKRSSGKKLKPISWRKFAKIMEQSGQ